VTGQAPTSRTAFDNLISEAERRALLKEEGRAINTRRALTEVATPAAGGRFKKVLGEYTVGSEEIPNYPRAHSPWSGNQVGLEPPIGIDVSFVEPCSEPHEWAVAAAIAEAAAAKASGNSPPPTSTTEVVPFLPISVADDDLSSSSSGHQLANSASLSSPTGAGSPSFSISPPSDCRSVFTERGKTRRVEPSEGGSFQRRFG
jgi:hypothetical protein